MLLAFGDRIRLLRDSIDEGHVVGENVEVDSLKEMTKVAYDSMLGEELPVERRITLFGGGQLSTEEGDGKMGRGRGRWGSWGRCENQ